MAWISLHIGDPHNVDIYPPTFAPGVICIDTFLLISRIITQTAKIICHILKSDMSKGQ